ncbi:MAG: putative 4-hydroxy-4-methyl-2-oxoglutarate aldolase [Flavobacteriaceae bacterium]|nr:MAG: putative 4-hydroxy-4-methyl-2-oxoglutarate aldolase [Flavobacteriaceae bacterium]
MDFFTADLYDQYGESLQVVEPIFGNYGGKKCFSGQMVTVKCHEDNSLVAELVKTPGKGKVMVVDGGGSLRRALLGDNLAKLAVENNWEGIVIYGCFRDSVEISTLDLGLKALATNPAKTEKKNQGEKNLVLKFAEATFTPGEYLYADQDGIVLSQTPLL